MYIISSASIVADARGLVFLLVAGLKALLQVFNILSSAVEARLPCLSRGGWCGLDWEEW
jgi:hypothetical protein